MSKSGTSFRVKVGGKTGATDAELRGAADPFFTQEDQSEDKFIPVRLQSGYLRIVDGGTDLAGNAFDWTDLIPTTATSRPVTLYSVNGGTETPQWYGYIQQQTFSNEYLVPTQEREFPVACCLSALEGYDYNERPDFVNFAAIINGIVTDASLPYTYFYFSGTYSVQEWLLKKVNNMVLMDDTGGVKYNYLQVLQEVCKFWGWTARSCAASLYFEAAEDASQRAERDFTRISAAQLANIASGTYIAGTDTGFDEFSMDGDEFATAQNSIEILPAIRKAAVSADIDKIKGYPAVPYEDIEPTFRQATVYRTDFGSTSPVYYFNHRNTYSSGSYQFNDCEIHTYVQTIYAITYGSWFDVVDWYTGQLADKKNYDWTCRLQMLGSSTLTDNPYFRLETYNDFGFSGGAIVLSATTYVEKCEVSGTTATYKTFTGNGTMTCRLAVGDKWWNGSAWTTTKSTFTVTIGNGGTESSGKGSIVTNRSYTSQYDAYTGWGIDVGTDLGGKVVFEIDTFSISNLHGLSQAALVVEDLKLGFVRSLSDSQLTSESVNEYNASNANSAVDTAEVQTIFATWQFNPPGNGLVFNPTGGYSGSVCYDYDLPLYQDPEQHLADRIASYHSVPRKLYKMQLLASAMGALSPISRVLTLENIEVYPISISRSWRDDIMDVYLIEI